MNAVIRVHRLPPVTYVAKYFLRVAFCDVQLAREAVRLHDDARLVSYESLGRRSAAFATTHRLLLAALLRFRAAEECNDGP